LDGDPEGMIAEIPALIASFGPLAAFCEPLSEQAGYMVVLDGPIKVDVFPIGAEERVSAEGNHQSHSVSSSRTRCHGGSRTIRTEQGAS